jgi:hypothetical protein
VYEFTREWFASPDVYLFEASIPPLSLTLGETYWISIRAVTGDVYEWFSGDPGEAWGCNSMVTGAYFGVPDSWIPIYPNLWPNPECVNTAFVLYGEEIITYEIPRDVAANGGGGSSDTSYNLSDTIGQAVIGHMAGAHLHGIGFWLPTGAEPVSDVFEDEEVSPPQTCAFKVTCPNPIQSVATVRFTVPERSRVVITLYDIAGRQLRRVVDEVREAGYHETELDASGLSAGVYFARMKVGRYEEIQRLILLR